LLLSTIATSTAGAEKMIREINDTDEVYDFVLKLSRDSSRASYPRFLEKDRVQVEIDKAITLDHMQLIASYDDNRLLGVCTYYWIEKESYAQTTMFLIDGDYDIAANEIFNHIQSELTGYRLLMGFPKENVKALELLQKKDMICIESSLVTHWEYINTINVETSEAISSITKDNFDSYSKFHDSFALEANMFYNSKKLLEDIDRFETLVYKDKGKIVASIFASDGKDLSDIVGLFIKDIYKNKGIEVLLLQTLLSRLIHKHGTLSEVLYFVDDDNVEELTIALEAGFVTKESYQCFEKLL